MLKSLRHFGCFSFTHVCAVSQLQLQQLSNPVLLFPRYAQRCGLAWIRKFTAGVPSKEGDKAESNLFGVSGSKSTSWSYFDDWENTFQTEAMGSTPQNSMFGLFGSKSTQDNATVRTAPLKTGTLNAAAEEAAPKNYSMLFEPLQFEASVKVDAPFLGFVIGKGGQMKKKLEKETETELIIPLLREVKNGSSLVVKGQSQAAVDEAVAQIQNVLKEAEASPSIQYSHFISLPLALHPALLEKIQAFQDSVLASQSTKYGAEATESVSYTETVDKRADVVEGNTAADEMKPSKSVSSYEEIIKENIAFLGEVTGDERKLKGYCSDNEEKENEDLFTEEKIEEYFSDGVHEENDDLVAECDVQDTEENGDPVSEHDREDTEENDSAESGKDKPGPPFESGYGIGKSIFIKPTTFHLTVLMLKLWNEDRVAAAADVLQGIRTKLLEALESRPVSVSLRGLECLGKSPAEAHVLYLRAEEASQEKRLAQACKVIIDAFSEAGLALEKDKNQELKMHATLMNTAHRRKKSRKHIMRRRPFDATWILSKHGSDDWGEHTIVEAHLSQRFVFREDGYYHCCSSIQFPLAPKQS